ncbi:DUF1566 domain-containing protein [Psychrobacter sp. I-STPA6b]|uniref:Lcl C-terminal domain-containing protein n=1 Tax=Psychrobacter sp. I-STPA6b TaxID=2585718 RepID=UPI001D0CC40B|nr:DUF1566 domain-containing protein [Psychrobacter sp. I-STPA6b]
MKVTSHSKIPTLLAASLSCLMLAGCGVDDKPTLPSSHTSSESNTDNKTPEISLINFSYSTSEGDGELSYIVTVKDITTLKAGKPVTIKYQLEENGSTDSILDLLKDPSQQSGTLTLTSEKPQIDLKIPLKSDNQATEDRKITIILSEPTGGAKLGEVTTTESTVKNTDLGLQISNATAIKGNAETTLDFTVSTSPKQAVTQDTKVFFEVVPGTAREGVDYTLPKNNFVVIKKGQDSVTIPITLIGEEPKTSKTFNINLLNDSQLPLFKGLSSGTATISNYVAEPAKRTLLNDTGVTFSGQTVGNDTDCMSKEGQDCNIGRDNTDTDEVDGIAGFSFTKLDDEGQELPVNATQWRCVKDNVTGLVWERKTFNEKQEDKDFQDAKYEYGYYNSQTQTGIKDTGKNEGQDGCGLAGDICSTEQYVIHANTQNLCGLTNWRLPTRFEIFNIVNLGSKAGNKALHADWLFSNPDNLPSSGIWTSSPAVSKTADGSYQFDRIWTVYNDGSFSKSDPTSSWNSAGVILVSNGETPQP